ncbi:bifunctional DNA primase/polymerase [Roseomonas sp. AR75]|uniref:bifunctional DNA primase/polymerase n=1 Tax=Roseomonas sp. AR75 TaxID=2562311 RepID=UPI0010BF9BCF|nr:bifunctional DNA primase/polymerase [Roseomonas sp. AR75]
MNDRPSFMASHGGRLADNGYAVIPIMPGSKVPGRFTASRWVPYPDWTRHADRPTKPFEIDIWQQWPDCGVGIACGAVVGIDIDVTDAALAIELASLATSMLGDTSCLRIGQSPKRLLVYRAAAPFAGRKRLPLEVLARGQQFVAHAIHPGTGQPYAWPEETLLDVPLAKLPAVDEAGAMAWLDRAHALIPPELKPQSLSLGSPPADWTGPADPRGTFDAVKAALAYLPNEDLDGASWITMGNAIKAALGEQGRELWLDWSRQSTKSGASGKADTPERRWKTLRPTRIGAGSIYGWAIDRGWVPPPEITLNAGAAERAAQPHPAAALLARADATPPTAAADVHPAAALLAKLDASRAKQQAAPLPVPAIILQPGGVLQMLVEECVSSALRPQPFLALGAAICAVGVLAGRKYRTRTDLRTNIYVAAVAESGGGKDHAPEVIRRCFDLAKLDRYLGGESLASGRGMVSALEQHPARLFQIDEFGLFLSTVAGSKAPTHKAEIWSELMKLYSRAKGVHRGTEYANKKDAPRVDIHQPCVCFYGTTTPSTFWKALEGGAMMDGSLARFLVFVTDNDRPDRNRTAGIINPPAPLLDALKAIIRGQGDPPPPGNLPDVHVAPMTATEEPTPFTVPMTAAAEALHEQKLAEEDAWAKRVAGTPQAAIVNRLAENAMKLALICAVSRNPAHPTITEAEIAWGWALAEHCTATLLRDAGRFLADSEFEKRLNKAINIIGKHGPCSRRDMFHKGLKLAERDFRDVIHALVTHGVVIEIQPLATGIGRPPGPRYALVQAPDETLSGEGASDE